MDARNSIKARWIVGGLFMTVCMLSGTAIACIGQSLAPQGIQFHQTQYPAGLLVSENIESLRNLENRGKTLTATAPGVSALIPTYRDEQTVEYSLQRRASSLPDSVKGADRKEKKNLRTLTLAAPAYTPELGPTLMGVMMISFKTNQEDTIIQRSSTPISIGASLRGSYFFNTIISTYWLEDRLRLFGEVRFRNMPDHYWGVGYDNASSNTGRDETTSYTRRYWRVNPKLFWQFKKHYFLGLDIDYHRTKVIDPNPFMVTDPDYISSGPVNLNSGLGLIARFDSRDVPVNPWKGSLIDFEHIIYSDLLGGDNNFSITTLDLKHFQQIFRPGSTLAMEMKLQRASADVPYTNMSMLGSPYDLRGYYLGHYRDRSMMFMITEYRHQFLKRDGTPGRHGMVGWVGTGAISGTFGEFANWIPNAGIGYRFEVQKRMNVRAEIGFGKQSRGFYISFNEAF